MSNSKRKTPFLIALFFSTLLGHFFVQSVSAYSNSITQIAVAVKITLPDGNWIRTQVIEDGFLKVKNEKTNEINYLTFHVLDKTGGKVEIKFHDVEQGKAVREIENLQASFNSPQVSTSFAGLKIEIVGVVETVPPDNSAKGSSDETSFSKPPECCVTCDG